MRILILGAGGFIGKNLVRYILMHGSDELVLFDRNVSDLRSILPENKIQQCHIVAGDFSTMTDFDILTKDIDIIYHLISTTLPSTSMGKVADGITENVVTTSLLLSSCVKNGVKKIIFLSSGGTVYGVSKEIPFHEDVVTNPISAYGMQKIAIEKLLYLYRYTYGMDYRVVRLANPYGTYQKPNGIQGVIAAFAYHALRDEEICVYGNGMVIRDYIYVDDAVEAIQNIAAYQGEYKVFNVGSASGTSVNEIIEMIERVLGKKLRVTYNEERKADVPINILNVDRYERVIGKLVHIPLEEGIQKTIMYLKEEMHI